MSAVSKRVMPASSAAPTTESVSTGPRRPPKLLQPKPTTLTLSEPIVRVSTGHLRPGPSARAGRRGRQYCTGGIGSPICPTAHEEAAMAAGAVDIKIEATPDAVWQKVGDFGGLGDFFPGIESFRLEGDDRIIGMFGMEIRERLLAKDDASRTIT